MFRDDGLLVVVSEGQIQLADRRTGFVGDPIELRRAVGSRFRPDGLVLIHTVGERNETIDLEGSALVERDGRSIHLPVLRSTTDWPGPTSSPPGHPK